MNQLWNLVKKELRELLTPASIASVVAVCVVLIILGSVIGGQVSESSKPKAIGIIDETAHEEDSYSSYGISFIEAYYVDKVGAEKVSDYVIYLDSSVAGDNGKIQKAMSDNNLETAILITKDYNTKMKAFVDGTSTEQPKLHIYWNQTSTSAFSSLSMVTGSNALNYMKEGATFKIVTELGKTPEEAARILAPLSNVTYGTTFFKGAVHDGVTPGDITSATSAQNIFVPMIIMLIIIMIGSILISSMGNEKENKTLETLLTLPISRTKVVTGKILGCALAGLVLGAIYMVGMYFYMSGFASAQAGGKTLSELGLALNGFDWVIVAFFMFMAIMCALGMCMILGAFAKNYKAAQTYVAPISVLAIIPMFVTMFTDFSALPMVAQAVLFLIPFTHPMMIMNNLMFGNTMMVVGGAIYLMIFAAVMIYITVRLYNSDVLLTGWRKGGDKKKMKLSWSDLRGKFQKS